MKKIALLSFLAIIPAFAQQPKFDLADVHVSTTPRWFAVNYAQNNGGHDQRRPVYYPGRKPAHSD